MKLFIKISVLLLSLLSSFDAYSKNLGAMISPGELALSHKDMKGISKCIKCHSPLGGIPDEKCLDCHKKIAALIEGLKGLHAKTKGKCIECHTDHKGESFDILNLNKDIFDHDKTGYPLTNKHKTVKCEKCHTKTGTYLDTPALCNGCHKDIHKGGLGAACDKCHYTASWKETSFVHNKDSKYILAGKHLETACKGCHKDDPGYKIEGFKECISCHKSKDKHKDGFGSKCDNCHVEQGWGKLNFNHSKTAYLLKGMHINVKCEKCHFSPKIDSSKVRTLCAGEGCHTRKKDKEVHRQQFDKKDCSLCHVEDSWKLTIFKHEDPGYTGFKLKGKHNSVKCVECHQKEKYKPIDYKTCKSGDCHGKKDYHKGQFKEADCNACHNEESWKGSIFKHEDPGYLGFKLKGKHGSVKCAECHQNEKYKPIDYKTCKSGDCHGKKDYHKGQFKEADCNACHNEESWKPSIFKHEDSSYTGFNLKGKHNSVKCAECHQNEKYKPIDYKTCKSGDCHGKKDYHKGQFKKKDCNSCHNEESWKPSTFKHEDSSYKLQGGHKKVECVKCHAEGKYISIEYSRCALSTCHKGSKVHAGKDYKGDCGECHNTDNWEPLDYKHQRYGRYRLGGIHNKISCKDCHKDSTKIVITGDGCASCHRDPHFNQFGYGCKDCHKEDRWIPSSFNHNKTGFRLIGGHRAAECKDCHSNRNYRNISSDCYQCHRADYERAPGHISAGYSTKCSDCHGSASSWTFNHRGISSGCSSCHLSDMPALHTTRGYGTTCENCHSHPSWTFNHNRASSNCSACHTASSSHALNGFSSDCSTCHRYPSWSFDHSRTTSFPTNHEGTNPNNCTACHAGSNYRNHGGCTDCHGSDAGGEHRGRQYPSAQCLNCHPSGRE